ncbi:hypothetical protein [Paenibacillus sp. J2TS4]|uniref:hypothetical protein n=1 Tax=Paenibacillus sp. J2TS4 TaxID=2807194 RepID=UPI001B2325DF|nr:hypothetical protein [Paenibacillus sp. J2TS4]GIP32531.1 hypothetical protein J2TS4_17410 [Paenibacillus sp. J2TS4]
MLKRSTQLVVKAFGQVNAPPEQLNQAMGKVFFELLTDHRNEILLTMMAHAIPEPAIREVVRDGFDQVYETIKATFERAGFNNAEHEASIFLGQGLNIALAELINLPKLISWDC